jgi:hypothetical protein
MYLISVEKGLVNFVKPVLKSRVVRQYERLP